MNMKRSGWKDYGNFICVGNSNCSDIIHCIIQNYCSKSKAMLAKIRVPYRKGGIGLGHHGSSRISPMRSEPACVFWRSEGDSLGCGSRCHRSSFTNFSLVSIVQRWICSRDACAGNEAEHFLFNMNNFLIRKQKRTEYTRKLFKIRVRMYLESLCACFTDTFFVVGASLREGAWRFCSLHPRLKMRRSLSTARLCLFSMLFFCKPSASAIHWETCLLRQIRNRRFVWPATTWVIRTLVFTSHAGFHVA